MERLSMIKSAALATVAALGVFAGTAGTSRAGDIKIGINFGTPPPPPPPAPVVYEYDTYVVGYRQNLYDADWRLRNARIELWHAEDDLAAARQHEGEVAAIVDDEEALVGRYNKGIADSEAAVVEARTRLAAYEKRLASAHGDLDAARTLHDDAGAADADKRIRSSEEGVAHATEDLHAAEAQLPPPDVRERLAVARTDLPRHHEELAAAADAVYAARQRVDRANLAVAVALHDRDEALWLLHRNEVLSGRVDFALCGFHVSLYDWHGRMPDDPEVVHAYYVHPVDYWVAHPVEIETRVVEVDQVTEITRIRVVEERHEPKFRDVVVVERSVPEERRRAYATNVTVERERLVADRAERTTAAAEHRAPRISPVERAEAKAIVIDARANAKATEINARANAKAEESTAHAQEIQARGAARSEEIKARADANAERAETRADVNDKQVEARADAKAKETEARADAQSERTKARADARAEETQSRAEANAKRSDAQAAEKSDRAGSSSANRSTSRRDPQSGHSDPNGSGASRDSRSSSDSSRSTRSSGPAYGSSRDKDSKDSKDKKRNGQNGDDLSSGR